MSDIYDRLKTLEQTIANDLNLGSPFIYDISSRLESFGYELQEDDDWSIGFSIQKVVNTIKNECNVSMIPDELTKVAVDMVCGEFLFAKKGSGQLEGFNIDLDAAIKRIQEGDTDVTFALGEGNFTPEQRLNALVAFLMTNGKNQFASFRRLKW